MKKILVIIFIVLLNISIINAEEYDQETIDRNLEQAEKAAEIEDTLKENGYPEYYGGIYISDDSTHVVMLIVEENLPKDINSKEYELLENIIRKHEDIEIKYVKNSYKKLLSLEEKIKIYEKNNQTESDISEYYIDIINNNISISIDNKSSRKIHSIRSGVLENEESGYSDILNFKETEKIYSNSLNAGQGINAFGVKDNCSMGYRAKINNKIGYITAAHCFNRAGESTVDGVVRKWKRSGSIDAAFVEITNNLLDIYSPTNELANKSGAIKYLNTNNAPTLIVNQVIAKVGVKSRYTTGKIAGVKMCVKIDNIEFSNIIKADYKGIPGDSGGPVFIPKNVNGGATLIGIHIGSGNSSTCFVQSSEIQKEFNYTRY